ncbi:MAG: ABC transporter substrate-binding protein [Spirochaetaceae bacterium]|nr:ABC transporter substrate-binding protein [Spirochaetaceae bacterium]
MLCFAFLCAACVKEKQAQITDRAGNIVVLPENAKRIISTTPANTEIIVGLGMQNLLVACDKYSTGIEGVPPGLPLLDMMNPDIEAILSCNPDLLIAHSLNKVNSSDNPFAVLTNAGISVVYVPMSNSVEGICEDIRFIAKLLNADERGEEIILNMQKQIDSLRAIAKTIDVKRSVYFEIEPAPFMTTLGKETYLDQIFEIIGAVNLFGDVKGVVFPSAEEIIVRNPDVMITNYSYNPNAALELKSRKGFEYTNAVKNNAVYLIDANASSRPSQHIIKAIYEIAKCVYPDFYN